MSSKGFDTPNDAAQVAHIAAADGFGFIAMYYFVSSAYKQRLTRARALAISAAGLHNVAVFENGYPTSATYFSASRGKQDALIAISCAQTATQPQRTPIYFAVDCDIPPSRVEEYFKAISAYVRSKGYLVGVYGSGAVCKALHDAGLVDYTWLSQSKKWTGYADWLPHCNLVQGTTGSYHGLDVDWDTSPNGNGGGWQIS